MLLKLCVLFLPLSPLSFCFLHFFCLILLGFLGLFLCFYCCGVSRLLMKYSFPVTSGLMTEALSTVTSDFQAHLFTEEPIGCLQRLELQACFFSVENCFRIDITLWYYFILFWWGRSSLLKIRHGVLHKE